MAERFLKFIIMIIAVCFKTVEENSFYLYLRCKKVKPEAATIKGGRAWKKSCLPSTRENGNLLTFKWPSRHSELMRQCPAALQLKI